MAGFVHENARPAFMSIALHALIVLALIFAADFSLHKPQSDDQPLPVEATVVDSRIVRAALSAKQDAAQAALQQRLAQQQAQQQRTAQQQELQQQELQQQKLQQQQLQQRQVQQQHLAQQREHAAQVHAEAAAAAAVSKRALEAAARRAEVKREAAAAAAAKREALAKAAVQREAARRLAAAKRAAAAQADLRRQIAAEEHAQQVASGPLADQYRAALQNRIIHAWIKPASARAGIDCLVEVTQVPGGDVTAAQVTKCNGDDAVRQSIKNAVYRASPLPEPPDPALFHRQFVFEFKPDE